MLFRSVDENGNIPKTKVPVLVEPELVDLARKNVELVDLRKAPLADVARKAKEIAAAPKPYAEPKKIEFFAEEAAATAPSPLSGHHIYDTSVFYAWVKLLAYAQKFGELKMTEYDEEQKEYNNILVTIGAHSSCVEMPLRQYVTDEEIREYYENNLLGMVKPSERGIAYTYGDRLFRYCGVDQIGYIVDKLGKKPYSRRAVAVLWNPQTDEEDEHGPCLNLLACNIHGDEVFMTAVFRSQDLYGAWVRNVLGLMMLQKEITERINAKYGTSYGPGRFSVLSVSAHIYRHDFKAASEVVREHEGHANRLLLDPKGLFVISITPKKTIKVEYRSNDGQLLESFEEADGASLYKTIANSEIFSFFVHSAYLGYQIAKAENALRAGAPYVQDGAPE